MQITRVSTCAALAILSLTSASRPLMAQIPGAPKAPSLGLSFGLKLTTLGFGGEIGYRFAPRIGVRVQAQRASLSRDNLTISGFVYGGSLKWSSVGGMLDLKLLGPLYLSGGIIGNGNQFVLRANPTADVTIGNTVYTAAQVDTISAKIAFKKAAPYFGLRIASGGRVGFVMEFGAMMQGTPILTYTATSTLAGAAKTTFDTQAQAEAAQLQSELDNKSYLKVYPVVGMGLQVRI